MHIDRDDVVLVVLPVGESGVRAARRAWEALPPFEDGSEEQAEATELHRLIGLLGLDDPPMSRRPFRAPHHTVSKAGMFGSASPVTESRRGRRERVGYRPRPGEVSLAHGGVLLLDQVLDFSRDALDATGEALYHRVASIVRGYPAEHVAVFPARPYAVVLTATPEDMKRLGRLATSRLGEMVTRRWP